MRKITPKLELVVLIFCILILIFLNLTIWYNGKDLSCDECYIDFRAVRRMKDSASNEIFQNFSVKIINLYENFLEDYCPVEFDNAQGYYLKNDTKIK